MGTNDSEDQNWKPIPQKSLTEQEAEELELHKQKMIEMEIRVKSSSKEEFIKYFSIHPKGNPEKIWTKLQYHVAAEKDFFGNVLTYLTIYQKWADYINQCNIESRDVKYIKGMEKFIDDKDYNCQFNIKNGVKSNWLDKLKG